MAALIGRYTASLYPADELRAQIYVDDPVVAIRGNPAQRRHKMLVVVTAWLLWGLPAAFSKAVWASAATWIGSTFQVTPFSVRVTVKESLLTEVQALTDEYLARNVIPIKSFRSFVGKRNAIASVLAPWRPFLAELYAAMHGQNSSGACPPSCIWTQQIKPALEWLHAFCRGISGPLTITFEISDGRTTANRIRLSIDACPWGIGAALIENGIITRWLACAITQEDTRYLQVPYGSADSQQACECLRLLVAARAWPDAG